MNNFPPAAPTLVNEVFPTTTAVRVDLNPGASGTSTLCISAIDFNDAAHVCYLRFGATVATTADVTDFQLTGNNIYRFAIGPGTKWMSMKLDTSQTDPFSITYFIEGQNG